jgi:hypothetical protein
MFTVFVQVEEDMLNVTVVRRPTDALGPNSDIPVCIDSETQSPFLSIRSLFSPL